MAQIKLTGDRERLIQGKWTLPGEVVTVPDKALANLVERLGDEIEVVGKITTEAQRSGEVLNDDHTGRVDGKTKRRSTHSKRNS